MEGDEVGRNRGGINYVPTQKLQLGVALDALCMVEEAGLVGMCPVC